MQLATLKELYIEELSDAYSAERQILEALPRMIRAARSPRLQAVLVDHLDATEGYVQRLEEVFFNLGEMARRKWCRGMEGVLAEGADLLAENGEPAVLDAAILAATQRVEHYNMAVYGTLRTYAETLGDAIGAALLEETLREVKEADSKLTQIALDAVNIEAATGMAKRSGSRSRH